MISELVEEAVPGIHKHEGKLTSKIEKLTSKVPSGTYLAMGMA